MNLVEILKNVPEGTKLYSPIWGEVILEEVKDDAHPIRVRDKHNVLRTYTADGKYHFEYQGGECLLFPSEEQRDWGKFQYFKDGDILSVNEQAFIFRGIREDGSPIAYCGIDDGNEFITSLGKNAWTWNNYRKATSSEEELLFCKMKEAGYKWDACTKTLSKIREDLPINTPVMVTEDRYGVWLFSYYAGNSTASCDCSKEGNVYNWTYIVPVDKFDFTDKLFSNKDNYGTANI